MSGVKVMPSRLAEIISGGEASNGVKALINEIRTHQKDMPPECVDDLTFGALVVLYDMGKTRENRIRRLELLSIGLSALVAVGFLVDLAFHGEVIWLRNLFQLVFGL